MSGFTRRAVIVGAALTLGTVGLAACGSNSNGGGGGTADANKTIALLLPESKTTRYESFDRPMFEAKVKELCSDCTVKYFNADQDEKKQAEQMQSAINAGARVVVLDPVNGAGAGGMVTQAQGAGAKVIAYDRFIKGADYYLSFDNVTVGKMQAEALVKAMDNTGGFLQLNGAPTDPNAAQFKQGANSVFETSGLKLLAPAYDNPDWSPQNAQKYMTDQLSKFTPAEIQGVYAANDGQAGGVIAALKGAGVKSDELPPVTGQDAELAAIQRIIAGEQLMTIYKPIKVEAEKAAEVAVALVRGESVGETTDYEGVQSFIFTPIDVQKDNVKDTVVADGFWTVQQICTPEFEAACKSAGLTS